MRSEAEMANITRGETECYISIEAECWVLYFTYSTWQGNDLSVIKNFLAIIIHNLYQLCRVCRYITSHPDELIVCDIYYLIHHCTGWGKPSEILPALCFTHIQLSSSSLYAYPVIRLSRSILLKHSTVHTSCCYMENIVLFCFWSSHANVFMRS